MSMLSIWSSSSSAGGGVVTEPDLPAQNDVWVTIQGQDALQDEGLGHAVRHGMPALHTSQA